MERAPLADKSIVIVGGTTGLGLSAARACVAAGASVLVVGRNPESAETAGQALGESGRFLVGDATRPETAERAIEAARRSFGSFHGLYHVAGGSGRGHGDGPLHELTDEGWSFTLELNLTSLVYSNRAAVRHLLRQGTGGSILNMGSVLGYSPSPRHFPTHAYAAAKSAVVGLTRASAAYYAAQRIRFNVLALALTRTPMAQRVDSDPQILDFIRSKQPLDGGRIGEPEDADAAVVFFLSDESRFVTGQLLAVDGGWSVSDGSATEAP